MTNQILHRRNFLLHLQGRPAYDGLVLIKEPAFEQLTSAQIAQLHNEHVITRQLVDVAGVRPVYGLEGSESHPVLLLKYIEGQSLAEIIAEQSLDLPSKLQLAMEIAGVLGRVHDSGVMHRDVNSSNIMVSVDSLADEPGGVSIIDFGVATAVRQEAFSQPVTVDAGAGTLAYISPEQTGRMNRAVDYRSDLYSLGVTCYELFTGQLPFQADDKMGMIHAHMAVEPVPPGERNPELPKVLSDIILKLLAKNAEDRYQSAIGLNADLEKCLDQLQDVGVIEPFELGRSDFTGRLLIPQKLYGRQTEIAQLMATYDRVTEGNAELLFIAGYSGVGKTALVHEIRREVLMRQGVFIEGKFDQLQRTLPYSAWAQAFSQLAKGWLAESETNLAGWRETILEAIGDNGQILLDIIPALEPIIGPQPDVPKLGGLENQNRLNYNFNRFISSLATPETPLVVFLDDLQWIDLGSINLIESLIAGQSASSFLIIGAYRDNKVGPDHPLVASQERMGGDSDRVRIIILADLARVDVDHILADTLQTTAAECSDLSQALLEATAGNPFFFRQQLYALESEALLSFDRQQMRWVWEEEDLLQSLQVGGNVADLMISKIQTLPIETQHTISMAACLGNRFETNTLNTITSKDSSDILTALSPALQEGLINRSNGTFSFVHDRIQEAGYAMIPEEDRTRTHLEIGRVLQTNIAAEALDEELFTIVGHLNAGRTLIESDSEKIDLAELNLKAGQKAKAAAAFADAKQYIEVGVELLEPDRWQEHYELTLSLYNENAELASVTGQFDQIDRIARKVHTHAKSFLDRVPIYMTTIEAETAQYNLPEALEIGLGVLRELDVEIPSQPSPADYQHLNDQLVTLLSSQPLEGITQLPEMNDERALAISYILASEMSTSYIVNPALNVVIQYLGAIFTLEYGLNAWSPFFFGVLTLLNIGTLNHETPLKLANDQLLFAKQLAGVVRELLGNPITSIGRTKALQSLTVAEPWLEPIENGIELAHMTFQSGYQTGDLLYGAYGALHYTMQGFASGVNLDDYQSRVSEYADRLLDAGQISTYQWLSIYLQATQSFKEVSPEPHLLNGTYFNEIEWLPNARAAKDILGLHVFSVNKLVIAYHFDLDINLYDNIGDVENYLADVPTVFSTATAYFYLPLARLRLVSVNSQEENAEIMKSVNNSMHLMEIWSQSVPPTFKHQYDLIAAEKARITGDLDLALSHYEQAISASRASGFTHEEALANELYARFWAERGNDRFAGQLMREAHSLYRKWGALAKAEHLANRYPNWLVTKRITTDESRTGTTTGEISSNLDILTVLKVSQTIAGEIELDRLLALLMTSALENSGAHVGCLLLPEEGRWMIAAQADLDGSKPLIEQPISMTESALLSQSVVNYVIRTQQTMLLDDASQSGEFVDDPHIQRQDVKSLLCTPLVNQGKTSAVLYLENNLSPGVFTPERVELLQLLSSQMAISIDNARTHDQLEQLLEERSRALRSSEAQIRTLFEDSPLGIALSSLEGQILTANKALLNMLRVPEEDLKQLPATDFYADPADRKTILADLQETGSVQEFGIPLMRHDGSSFFGSINISKLVLEGNEVLLTMVEDVTKEITAQQEAAVLEERERLARELHDAVTQTLFSASVLAQTTPRLLEKNPDVASQNMKQLDELIRGALAEMRTLLLELRPNEFREKNLAQLFDFLAESTRARTQANVSMNVDSSCSLSEDVAIALYRITQESLNNVAKYALASEIVVDLSCDPSGTILSIKDDGRGFDPLAIPAGHFGVSIMRERAQKIGASIKIDSEIGRGTQVTVSWSAAGKESAWGDETEHE